MTATVMAFSGSAALAVPKSLSWISVDAKTGRVLAQHDAYKLRHPASLTKMMTIYMALDAIEDGRWTMQTRLKVSENAGRKPASKLYVKAGTTITVSDAIHALAIKSANDVATVVAENYSGTEAEFAEAMTKAARQLGMKNTTFKNASGLHDEGQVTTAYDMYRLGLALQDRFPREYGIFAKTGFRYHGKWIGGHNPFLGKWRGVDGIKTGYTRASGFNLVTNLKKSNRHLIAVVIGADTSAQRNDKMAQLMSSTFARTSTGARTLARIDRDVWVEPVRITWTANMRPEVKARDPEGADIEPPEKPRLLAQMTEQDFYAKDTATLQRMLNDIARMEKEQPDVQVASADSEIEADEPALATVGPVGTISTRGSAGPNWDLFSRGMNDEVRAANLGVHEERNPVEDCLKGQECYMVGAEIDEKGHVRISSPSIYSAMVTSVEPVTSGTEIAAAVPAIRPCLRTPR
ncbi:D-alanyl-D-alanine carboxypeptidase family protein [Roseivivax sp. CAU 1761]